MSTKTVSVGGKKRPKHLRYLLIKDHKVAIYHFSHGRADHFKDFTVADLRVTTERAPEYGYMQITAI